MPNPRHAQRSNVLGQALTHGWQHDMGEFDGGSIIRDTFTSELGEIRVVWLRTPWSDSGRYAGALYSERATRKDRNVWKVTQRDGLLELLGSLASERV